MRRLIPLAAWLVSSTITPWPPSPPDRRVVDTVIAGDEVSEAQHGYLGDRQQIEMVHGQRARRVTSSVRYTLTTFDDTEVTVACTFLGATPAQYDLLVHDRVVATKQITPHGDTPTVVEVDVPFPLTKGQATTVITLRPRDGATLLVQAVRTIQEHNERPQ